MKITPEDRQVLFDLFNDSICIHTTEAKLRCEVGEITKKQLKAELAHAEYLQKLSHKVLKMVS